MACILALGVTGCSKNTEAPAAKASAPAGPPPETAETADRTGTTANLTFTLKDMNGASVALASYKGKPLVINFWATWCPPCKEEIPWFIAFKQQYAAQGLEILGISIDDPAPELQKFAAEQKMNYPVLMGLDQDTLIEAYDAVASVPVTWFIKKDGTVEGRTIGINTREFFENQIKRLF